ncbi:hypothetical protein OQX61_23570 [Pedobacter sp. PLR]|uniref:hypothetical protein n=1 Tax=Pedobacter sp. PLR TaxID=2994465 RepID=UPI002247004D|nr:hypothetical protein [Pedobacter sp. PLR]MCX2454271.1 hypothetical protein [Pedobacter sp. PLR]
MISQKLSLGALLVLFNFGSSYAQSKEMKVDTLQLPVYYVKYTEEDRRQWTGQRIDVLTTYRIVPVKTTKRVEIPYLLEKGTENDFNGFFLSSTDDLISFGMLISTNDGRTGLSYYDKMIAQSGLPLDFTRYVPIPNAKNKRLNLYAAALLDATWIKYSFNTPSEPTPWQTKYHKYVPGADGKTYNFYLIKKVNEVSSIVN